MPSNRRKRLLVLLVEIFRRSMFTFRQIYFHIHHYPQAPTTFIERLSNINRKAYSPFSSVCASRISYRYHRFYGDHPCKGFRIFPPTSMSYTYSTGLDVVTHRLLLLLLLLLL